MSEAFHHEHLATVFATVSLHTELLILRLPPPPSFHLFHFCLSFCDVADFFYEVPRLVYQFRNIPDINFGK